MSFTPKQIDFAGIADSLTSREVWQYDSAGTTECHDVAGHVLAALRQPTDFPPLGSAIVPGDHIALAVDPNIPGLLQVIEGAVDALSQTSAESIEIILGDEARDPTVDAIAAQVGSSIRVVRHRSCDRESVRYLGADEHADPIYLNRALVDADFVLPIVAGRPLDTSGHHDLTGVFPAFADSRARARHRRQMVGQSPTMSDPQEIAWLLGVQLMACITSTAGGAVEQVIAGTPNTVADQLASMRLVTEKSPRPADLAIASLDGSSQQQSWCNAARAAAAASRFVQPEGTIVLWTAIDQPPAGQLKSVGDERSLSQEVSAADSEEEFPAWDESISAAQTLARIASQYRLMIHSQLDDETIESMGLGSVASVEQLARLSESYEACGVLRAAQYAGTTFDMPHHVA